MAGHHELFPVGSIFDPKGHELIDQFLRRRIAGVDCGHFSSFIHDADVYSAPPGDLVEQRAHAPGSDKHDGKGGVWYFFSPAHRHQTKGGRSGRRKRVVDEGEGYNWHSEKGEPVLDSEGNRVGRVNLLSFGIKRPGAAARTRLGWCMREYSLDDDHQQDGAAGLVLCKIYVSGHKKEITYASVINAPGSKKKRKAADVQHPEAPRPKTPRRQEPTIQEDAGGTLREFERSFMSDQDETLPPGVVDNGSVDPGGFFTDMLPELGVTLQGNTKAAEHGSDCTLELEESLAGKHGDVQCAWEEMFGEKVA